jgi:hypothetical protein
MAGDRGGGSRLEAKKILPTPGTNFNPGTPLAWLYVFPSEIGYRRGLGHSICVFTIQVMVFVLSFCFGSLHGSSNRA